MRNHQGRVSRLPTVALAAAVVLAGGVAAAVVDREPAAPETLVAQPATSPAPSPAATAASCDQAPPPREHDLPPAQPRADGGYPRGSRVEVSLEAACTTVRVGQPLRLRWTASGDSATPSVTSVALDGLVSASSASCLAGSDDPAPPEPGTATDVIEHVYTEPKTDTVTVTAGHTCSYYQGSGSASVEVTVLPR